MKVLHISTRQNWGGGEQQVLYLLKYLPNESHTLLCPTKSPLYEKARFPHVRTIPFLSLTHFLQLIFLPYKIWSLVRQIHPDLIHAHDSHSHTIAWLAAILWKVDTPLIVHRRVILGKHSSLFSKLKYNHPNINRFICVSEAVKHSLQEVVKKAEKLKVVYSSIEIAKFPFQAPCNFLKEELQLPESTKIIGNIAALLPAKDYPTFLATAALMLEKRKDLVFIITGEGPELIRLRNLTQKLNISNFVFFLGFRRDIERILPSFDVFLFTSQSEGLGTIVLDAMECRVPVVTTRSGGISEIIRDSQEGLIAEPGDSQSLAEKISLLLEDEIFRNKITNQAFNKVKSFEASRMATQTLSIYKEILNINN